MKFSYKILICTIMIMAAAFGFSGYYFVNYIFETSLEREVSQAMDDSSVLQFAFETAALNIPSKYDILPDSIAEQIGFSLENSGQGNGRLLRLSDEEKRVLYVSDGFAGTGDFLDKASEETRIYQVLPQGEHYYIQTGTKFYALGRVLYLETMRDVTEVFKERAMGFSVYRRVTVVVLFASSIVMSFLSHWLTVPIRRLKDAAKKMASGDYRVRAACSSTDEMGELTRDFNRMAEALENTIQNLKEEVQAREEFIAAFSHELKTPLTSMVGYADMLRSRKLEEEKQFLAANYIYTESRRLEKMSFRLLDMIVAKRQGAARRKTEVSLFFEHLREMFGNSADIELRISYEAAEVCADTELLTTVLINLTDNAVKATEPGGVIELKGRREEEGYRFLVKDYGEGIPAEECRRITEAFYMVDKSRSRSKNGAGLGLALCSTFLELHGTCLEIESRPGEGSCFSFLLPKEVLDEEK